MYYDSKSDFYIRQYGPKIGIALLSVAIIVSGIYIYCSTQFNTPHPIMEAKNDETIEQNSLKDVNVYNDVKVYEDVKVYNEPVEIYYESKEVLEEMDEKDIEISRGLTATLRNLKVLDKTGKCKVQSISDNNAVVVFLGNRYYEINLIGMDYSRSNKNLTETIRKDLEGKEVSLAFDKLRVKGGQVYGYVYLDEKVSYNEYLLQKGLTFIKIEKTNTSMLDKLVSAQKQAKENKLGIWAK